VLRLIILDEIIDAQADLKEKVNLYYASEVHNQIMVTKGKLHRREGYFLVGRWKEIFEPVR
jgi:hypothetical protein